MPRISLSARRFHVLADPIRLRIILLLKEEERCVGDLCDILELSQPKVSYHLKLMLTAGIIKRRTEGTWCYYSLARDIREWAHEEFNVLFDSTAKA